MAALSSSNLQNESGKYFRITTGSNAEKTNASKNRCRY